MTGQTMQEALAGEFYFGAARVEELMEQCIDERKKIVWFDEFNTGIDAMSYSLEKI